MLLLTSEALGPTAEARGHATAAIAVRSENPTAPMRHARPESRPVAPAASPSLLRGPAARAAPPTSHGRGCPAPRPLTAGPRGSGPDKVPKARERHTSEERSRPREREREGERGAEERETPSLQPPRLPFALAASASASAQREEEEEGRKP